MFTHTIPPRKIVTIVIVKVEMRPKRSGSISMAQHPAAAIEKIKPKTSLTVDLPT